MRLWHQDLIKYLPRQQLLGQHRECCALRGAGWGRRHSVVNYVFEYNPNLLVAYHILVMNEMKNRGYNPSPEWYNIDWRGNTLKEQNNWCNREEIYRLVDNATIANCIIYPEHNKNYLKECLDNLRSKNIIIEEVKI